MAKFVARLCISCCSSVSPAAMSSEVTTAGPTSAPSVTLVSAARLEQGRAMVEQARRRASSREAITLTVQGLVWNQSVFWFITPGNWVKASQLTVALVWIGAQHLVCRPSLQ